MWSLGIQTVSAVLHLVTHLVSNFGKGELSVVFRREVVLEQGSTCFLLPILVA